MGIITISLDDKVEAEIRLAAKSVNLSLNQWITNLISEHSQDQWPESVKQLAGAWNDFPTLKEIRDSQIKDVLRERL